MTFTTASTGTMPPAVSTLAAASIATNSATVSGNLTSLGTAGTVNVSFEYGLTATYGSTTATQGKTTTGTFNANLSSLSPGITYHFRADADGGLNGTASGPDLIFTTAIIPPAVSTLAAISIGANSATVSGNLISLGTAVTVNASFEYGTDTSYGGTTMVQALTTTGLINATLNGLNSATTYHFRIKADGGIQGITNGVDTTFTTASAGTIQPSIVTTAATSIASNSATVNGNLTSLGTAGTVNVSCEYGLTNAYGSTTAVQAITAAGVFTFNLTGLTPVTVYHFRANADGGVNGTASGADMTFSTIAEPSIGGVGGGGGAPQPTPTIPVSINGTGSVDISSVVSKDGLFKIPVTLQSQDGNAVLSITKNTVGLTGDAKVINSISVTQVDTPTLPSPPAGLNIVSTAYNFEPSGATFNPAVSMTLRYNPVSLHPGANLLVDYFDTTHQQWVNLPDFAIDIPNNIIVVQVSHFTTFAVLEQLPKVPAATPTPAPATTPSAPAPVPTSTLIPAPTPTSAPPVVTHVPIPTPPQTVPTSFPESKTVSTLWIIIMAVLVAILIILAGYLLLKRRRKSDKAIEEAAEQAEEYYPNTTLYKGTVKLTIRAPIYLSQMQALEKYLGQSPDLRIESTGGSTNEANIIISIDERKPILLIQVLRAMPPVKQVITKNDQIVITLQPPN